MLISQLHQREHHKLEYKLFPRVHPVDKASKQIIKAFRYNPSALDFFRLPSFVVNNNNNNKKGRLVYPGLDSCFRR